MKHLKKFNENENRIRTYDPDDYDRLMNAVRENDIEEVKSMLDSGLDPNMDRGMPIRQCTRGGWKNTTGMMGPIKISNISMGDSRLDMFKLLVEYGAKLGDNFEAVKWAAEYGRTDMIDYMIDECGLTSGFRAALNWIRHTKKMTPELNAKVVEYLEDKIDKYE